eukprot:TRINITY_DN37105_c0_g1_i1.p1 TRINITY_DN37105_c0_g1~~TRINITY_DN37105_c0_g1_i1.p1  ORF type:complete len:400 (+),score=117.54 TRINITY_DN37105_c0_g1_i1:152-1351(+)
MVSQKSREMVRSALSAFAAQNRLRGDVVRHLMRLSVPALQEVMGVDGLLDGITSLPPLRIDTARDPNSIVLERLARIPAARGETEQMATVEQLLEHPGDSAAAELVSRRVKQRGHSIELRAAITEFLTLNGLPRWFESALLMMSTTNALLVMRQKHPSSCVVERAMRTADEKSFTLAKDAAAEATGAAPRRAASQTSRRSRSRGRARRRRRRSSRSKSSAKASRPPPSSSAAEKEAEEGHAKQSGVPAELGGRLPATAAQQAGEDSDDGAPEAAGVGAGDSDDGALSDDAPKAADPAQPAREAPSAAACDAEALELDGAALAMQDWLRGLDGGRGSLLRYLGALLRVFDGDLALVREARLAVPTAPGLVGSVDASFFEAVGVSAIGHKMLFAKGILALP